MPLGIDATIGYIDPDPSNGAHRLRLRDRQPVQHAAPHRAAADADREPGHRRRSAPPCTPPTCRTSTTSCAAATARTGSASATTSSCPTRPSALDEPVPRARVAGSTRTVGIIGWPVSHSLSPAIHNAAFAALSLDWVYVPLPVHPLHLLAALTGLGAMGFAGANVTMPHKAAVADLIDELPKTPGGSRREHDCRRRRTAPRGEHRRARLRAVPPDGRGHRSRPGGPR